MMNGEMLEILVGYEESREELVSSGLPSVPIPKYNIYRQIQKLVQGV